MSRQFVAASSQYLSVDASPVVALPFSGAFFFKCSDNNPSAAQWIFFYGNAASTTSAIHVYVNSTGTISLQDRSVAAGLLATTVTDYADGAWHSCVFEVTESGGSVQVKLWIDNASAITDTNAGTSLIASFTRLAIGMQRDSSPAAAFSGFVSRVLIFGRTLSDAEALEFYTTGNIADRTSCAGDWDLTGNESPETDDTANANHLTVTGATYSTDEPSVSGPLTAGVLAEVSHDSDEVTVSWTAASGGTAPYTAQLQVSAAGAGTWSNVSGATTSPATASGLSPLTAYDFRVAFTDSAAATAYSNTVEVTTDTDTNGVAISTPDSYQVFQRSGSTGSIFITGTYTGTPTAIQARFNGGAWSTIDAAPAGGSFSGTLSSQPQGQGTIEVRFSNDTGVSASVTNVGIGDVFLCIGQSNMSGRGTNSQVYSHATLKAGLFGNDYVWKELADPYDSSTSQIDTISSDASADGSVIPLLATELMEAFGVPVAFVPAAKGATAITSHLPGVDHQDRSTLYGSAVYRALQVGGVRAVLWWQGENDALDGMSQATYNGHLDTIANAIQADLGVKLMPCVLQDCTDAGIDAGIAAVRAATIEAWTDNNNVLVGPDFSDLETDDDAHLKSDAKLLTAAERWAAAIEAAFAAPSGTAAIINSRFGLGLGLGL